MKFLSAGDRHKPQALAIYRTAIERYPDARFILGQVDHVHASGVARWKIADEDSYMLPPMAMELAALNGNLFHSLIAPLFHADVVRGGFAFGEDVLSFCADALFLMGIGKATPTYFIAQPVAEMIMEHRQTYGAMAGTRRAILEEGYVRILAAGNFLDLTGDQAKYDQLSERVTAWTMEKLDSRASGN
jgi:hypothetical protein